MQHFIFFSLTTKIIQIKLKLNEKLFRFKKTNIQKQIKFKLFRIAKCPWARISGRP